LKNEHFSSNSSSGIQPLGEEEESTSHPSSIMIPRWLTQKLSDTQENVEAPRITVWESRIPRKLPNYMEFMSRIIDVEPSIFEEVTHQQVWQDGMIEDYASIMKNDVWDIVLRLEEKSVVSSKWIFKIKHAAY